MRFLHKIYPLRRTVQRRRSFFRRILSARRGQAVIVAVLFFLIISSVLILGLASPVMRELRSVHDTRYSKDSYVLAEAAVEDLSYRLREGMNTPSSHTLSIGETSAGAVVTDTARGKRVEATGDARERMRTVSVNLLKGIGVSVTYGVQSDEGGVDLSNQSRVEDAGVYAAGELSGGSGPAKEVDGDVYVSGSSGRIYNIHATGDGHASIIEESEIDGDAYYQTLTNTVVWGTTYPDTPPPPPPEFPLADREIDAWKQVAESGQTVSCSGTHQIDLKNGSGETFGPARVTCDLEIRGNKTIKLQGPIWVEGDVTFMNGPKVEVDATPAYKSVPVIADGEIDVRNKTTFVGTPEGGHVLLVSLAADMNQPVIDVGQHSTGDVVVFAPDGLVELGQNTSIAGVSGYGVVGGNQATVDYNDVLTDLVFDADPDIRYTLIDWREVK